MCVWFIWTNFITTIGTFDVHERSMKNTDVKANQDASIQMDNKTKKHSNEVIQWHFTKQLYFK